MDICVADGKEHKDKHILFGFSENEVEEMLVCDVHTYKRWKAGKVVYFPRQKCFASFGITPNRFLSIMEWYDKTDDETGEVIEDKVWRKKWMGMSGDDRDSWYMNFLKETYNVMTFNEFMTDRNYDHFELPTTIGVGDRYADGIAFGRWNPNPEEEDE